MDFAKRSTFWVWLQMDLKSACIFTLGVVHNCQNLPISTESTNLGEGGGGEGASVLFLKC